MCMCISLSVTEKKTSLIEIYKGSRELCHSALEMICCAVWCALLKWDVIVLIVPDLEWLSRYYVQHSKRIQRKKYSQVLLTAVRHGWVQTDAMATCTRVFVKMCIFSKVFIGLKTTLANYILITIGAKVKRFPLEYDTGVFGLPTLAQHNHFFYSFYSTHFTASFYKHTFVAELKSRHISIRVPTRA